MSGLNKVMLIGRLTKNPEVKYTPSGVPVARFGLATNERWKDKNGEKKDRVEFHNIVVWNKLAEICGEYLTKGKQVYIEGKIQSREWEDRGGVKRTQYEIVAHQMLMLGSKGEGEGRSGEGEHERSTQQPAGQSAPEPESEISDEEIPF